MKKCIATLLIAAMLACMLCSCTSGSGGAGTPDAAQDVTDDTGTVDDTEKADAEENADADQANADEAEKAEPDTPDTADAADTDAKEEEKANEAEADKEDTTDVEPEIIQLYRKHYADYKWSKKYEQMIARVAFDTIYVDSSQANNYPALTETLKTENEKRDSDFKKEYKDLVSSAKADIKDFGDTFIKHEYTEDMKVRRADSNVVSLLSGSFLYTGGAHGMYAYGGYNYDPQSGKELTIDDVVKDKDAFAGVVEELVNKYWGDEQLFDDVSVSGYIKDPETVLCWTVDMEGVTVYFNPYEIAPYASGSQVVTVTFEDNPDLFVDKYMKTPKSATMELFQDLPTFIDLDDDGTMEEVVASSTMDENDYYENLVVSVDDAKVEEQAYVNTANPVLVKMDDEKYYIYYETVGDNDYELLFMFDLADKKPVFMDSFSGGMGYTVPEDAEESNFGELIFANPDNVQIMSFTDLLSTVSGIKTYSIGSDGKPTSEDKIYVFPSMLEFTVKKSITTAVVDKETYAETGEKITLKKNEKVKYYGTDNKDYAYLLTSSGKLVCAKVVHNKKDWNRYIDGKKIEKVFKGLLFAG